MSENVLPGVWTPPDKLLAEEEELDAAESAAAENVKLMVSNKPLSFDFNQLLMDFHQVGDAVIVCPMLGKDGSVQHSKLKTSKFLLAACSTVLHSSLINLPDDEPATIILPDTNGAQLESFLNLILNGSVSLKDNKACEDLTLLLVTLGAFGAERCQYVSIKQSTIKSNEDKILGATEVHVNYDISELDGVPPPKKRPRMQRSSDDFKESDLDRAVAEAKLAKSCQRCTQCNKDFPSFDATVNHLEDHIIQAVWAVDSMVLEMDLNPVHQMKLKMDLMEVEDVSDSQSFTCKFCYGVFGAQDRFILHLQQHMSTCKSDNSTLWCSICCLRFNNVVELFLHQRLHELERRGESHCGLCNKLFSHPTALRHHKRISHKGMNRPKTSLRCTVCYKILKTALGLQFHMELHSSPYGIPDQTTKSPLLQNVLVCDICGFKTSKEGRSFENHMQTHLDVKKYQCQQCDQSFSIKYLLENHIKKHKGEFPCLCDICGKGFTYISHMKSHKNLVHNRFFKYQCTICNVKLKAWQNARKHILIHSDIKPYHCSFCKESFSYQSEIDNHRKKGHGGERFSIKKVLLPIHNEMIEKAIKPIPPEPIPQGFKLHQQCNKAVIKEIKSKKYSGKEQQNAVKIPVSSQLPPQTQQPLITLNPVPPIQVQHVVIHRLDGKSKDGLNFDELNVLQC